MIDPTAAIDSTATIEATATVEVGVAVGAGTAIWDHVHVRGPAVIGSDCIIGEKTYIAYDVAIGDRVKVNAFVYVCARVTIEDGVMVGARVTFTNDRFPRATAGDLQRLAASEPGPDTVATTVGRGATIGAAAVIGPGAHIGPFAMVGMASVVTAPVAPHHLVVGSPAHTISYVCRCGRPFARVGDEGTFDCGHCARSYDLREGTVVEVGGA